MYMSTMQETIALLITKETLSDSNHGLDEYNVSKVKEFSESVTFHRVFRSFWAGHYDRCLYHADKSSALSGEWPNHLSCPPLIQH